MRVREQTQHKRRCVVIWQRKSTFCVGVTAGSERGNREMVHIARNTVAHFPSVAGVVGLPDTDQGRTNWRRASARLDLFELHRLGAMGFCTGAKRLSVNMRTVCRHSLAFIFLPVLPAVHAMSWTPTQTFTTLATDIGFLAQCRWHLPKLLPTLPSHLLGFTA